MDTGNLTDPELAAFPTTAEECRALMASSIDRAIEERCVLRSEFLDLTFELDSRASVLEAMATPQAIRHAELSSQSGLAARLPVTGARVVQTPGGPTRYKVVLEHVGGARTEHPVTTVAAGEAMIRAASSPAVREPNAMRQAPIPARTKPGLRLV